MPLQTFCLVMPSHSSFISFTILPLHLFSLWHPCPFVSVHFIYPAWGVLQRLALFVQYLSTHFCLHPSLWFSLQKSGFELRQESACCFFFFFLTHSSFLKSKPTEAKSGYYLSCAPPHPWLLPNLPVSLKVYEFLHFERKQRAAGQS